MNTPGGLESAEWLELVTHRPLGILTDLDGTLLPFASTPDEARPSPEVVRLIEELSALPGVTLAIVSGRPKVWFEHTLPATSALIVAEHGAWRHGRSGWESLISLDPQAIDSLAAELERVVESYPGAFLERKTWALALHYRNVPARDKMGLLVHATAVVDPWLSAHRDFDDLAGTEVLEVRPRAARKDNAVAWMRALLGPEGRLVTVGDDVTDEDMFSAMTARDAAIVVGDCGGRSTTAGWRLESVDDAVAFYRWIVATRREQRPPEEHARRPSRVPTVPDVTGVQGSYQLLVLSNRLPELRSSDGDARKRNVGGLVSALAPALTKRKGIWLGWSGRTRPDAAGDELGFDRTNDLSLAWMDFPDEWQTHYYNGLSNSALWPLFHSFPERARLSHADWTCYERANAAFANAATKLVGRGGTVWVHDYHLLLLGKLLRERGHRGPIGFFQHIPFPAPDLFFLLPWATEILEAMVSFDLVGFHTAGHVENFLACAARAGLRVDGDTVSTGARKVRVGRFPLGIIPGDFSEGSGTQSDEIAGMVRSMGGRKIVLGVDRLDYTKGIPERIAAFGSMLQQIPALRRQVCMVQVSVPSRADIPDYAEQRSRVENIVGRVNGEYGEADWVPVRYLYRSYGRSELSELYRVADVGYVTPLRDGMNLVAKEYVAAQDATNPGVLLLSRFAGSADELGDALLTNPWDSEGTARDLARALEMPLAERRARHGKLMAVIAKTTAVTWAESFLGALAEAHRDGEREPVRSGASRTDESEGGSHDANDKLALGSGSIVSPRGVRSARTDATCDPR